LVSLTEAKAQGVIDSVFKVYAGKIKETNGKDITDKKPEGMLVVFRFADNRGSTVMLGRINFEDISTAIVRLSLASFNQQEQESDISVA